MSDNKVVQGLWFYGDLPLLQRISIASFLANGHDYHLYTYGPVGKVPPGTTLRDAAELMAQAKVPETFCPVPWFHFRDLLSPGGLPELPKTTFAVHLWNSIWRRQRRDTNAAYHPLSAYEGWKLKFLGGSAAPLLP